MTRTRRRDEPTDPWLIVTAVLAVILLVLVGAAVLWLLGTSGEEPSPSPTVSASASVPSAAPSASTGEPSASASAEPSGAVVSPSPAASAGVSPSPAASAEPSASASPGVSPDASGCSGSEENQVFYAQAADALAFETYCAALPSGWSLVSASYRGASGGKLEISYKGPGGATLVLRQGPNACADLDDCPPGGSELGDASFGDRSGVLLDTSAGLAVNASEGATFYIAETTGLDRDATTALTSALVHIR